jgi:uncharacterized membrane protein YraQ (UPF0718 family)/copper chaperone CopZ
MIEKFLTDLWSVVLELGFPLILGMAIAGGLHVLLPAGFVHRNFGGRGVKSVFMASLIGVPMPLCSCGVIPTAIGLKKDGASNGAATSFLISTPQTGVDSILVSATFLGWPFAIFKVIVAFITGIFGGSAVDFIERNQKIEKQKTDVKLDVKGFWPKLKEAINFSLLELLGMIYGWIIFGVIVAALITTFVPPGYLSSISWISGIGGLFLMLLIALPLYVCATASVPIAASLIAAGMPPGAALVFLMAGPATNVATIGALYRVFGKKVVSIYIATVAIFSIFFGWLFDFILGSGVAEAIQVHHDRNLFYIIFAAILIGLLGYLAVIDIRKKILKKSSDDVEKDMLKLKVKGMTCQHCAANVTKAIESVSGVTKVKVSLDDGSAYVDGDADKDKLIASIKNAGYEASI